MIGVYISPFSESARHDMQGFDQDFSILRQNFPRQEIELLSLSRPSGLTVQRGIRTWTA